MSYPRKKKTKIVPIDATVSAQAEQQEKAATMRKGKDQATQQEEVPQTEQSPRSISEADDSDIDEDA